MHEVEICSTVASQTVTVAYVASNRQWKRGSDGVTVALTLMHAVVPAVISCQMCACEPKLPCQHPCSSSSHLPLHAAVFFPSLPPSTTLPAFIHILALFRFDVMHLFLYETKVKEKIRKNILRKPWYGMELHSIPSVTSAAIWLVQPSGVFEILGDKFLIHCLWAQRSFMRMNKLKICLRCLNPFFGRAHSQNVLRLQGLCNSGMFWDGDGGIGLGLWAQGLIPFLGLQVKWETWWSWIKVITLKHICISTARHAETIARGFSVRKSLTSTSETLKTLGRT